MSSNRFATSRWLAGRRLLRGMLLLLVVAAAWWGSRWGYSAWADSRTAEYKRLCEAAVSRSDWSALERAAEDWSEWDGRSAEAWLYLAESRQQQGDPVSAVDCLLRVPDDDPRAAAALLAASELQFGQANRPLDAVATLERLVRIEPSLITARQRLIFFYALTLQRDRLLAEIREAIRQQAEPPEVYPYLIISNHLSFTNGAVLNQRWLRSRPDSELLLVAQAVQLSDTMSNLESSDREPPAQREARERHLRDLRRRFPENAALLRYLLHRAVLEMDVPEVGRLLAAVPDEHGGDSVFWRCRGWYHAEHSELEDAERAYRRALELDRLDWNTWHGLAGVLRRQGQLEEAERCQAIAVEGKQLRKELMQLPNVRAVSSDMLERIRRYAEGCGDELVARGIAVRLYALGQRPAAEPLPASPARR